MNIGSLQAKDLCLPDTSVLRVCLPVLLLRRRRPLWDFGVRESCVLLLPRLEVEARLGLLGPVTM
jgi:hypothetical protein